MAILGGLGVKLSMNLAEWSKNVKSVTKDINTIRNTVGGFKNAVLGAFAVDQLATFGKAIFDVTAQFQTFEVTLTNTLGSKSAAKQALEEVRQFATETPFAVAEVSAAYVRWANQGLSPTTEKLKKLGDVASALGGGFEQTAEAFKDLAVGQTKRIEELGILATQAGGKIQLAFKGERIEIEKTAEGVDQALNKFSQLPGVLGTTEAVSKTLSGKLSNLKDNFDNLLLTIGNKSGGVIGAFLDLGINALSGVNKALNDNGAKLVEERDNLNILAKAAFDEKTSKEARLRILKQIQLEYPDFLKNIDIEKVTNEQLKSRLEDVNKQFGRKIALMISENEVMRAREPLLKLQREENDLLFRKQKLEKELQNTSKEDQIRYNKQTGAIEGISNAYKNLEYELKSVNTSITENQKNQADAVEREKFALEGLNKNAENFATTVNDYFKSTNKTITTSNQQTTEETEKEWKKRLDLITKFENEIYKVSRDNANLTDLLLAEQFNRFASNLGVKFATGSVREKMFKEFKKDTESGVVIPTNLKVPNKDEIQKGIDEVNKVIDSVVEPAANLQEVLDNVNLSFQEAAKVGLQQFGAALGKVFSGDMKFGDAVLIGLKAFLSKFGKLLVAYGVASEAFKKAFKNPYVAIAAGIALTALSGAISNTAERGVGSSSSSVGTGFERMTSSGFSQNINVTGKLVGSGRDLVAVIGTTGYDNKYTKIG